MDRDLIQEIIADAVHKKASDIHFDPEKDFTRLNLRIDGVIIGMGNIEKDKYQELLRKIKLASKLRIDDHDHPKDGSFEIYLKDELISVRVSIIPIRDGENVVLRLFHKNKNFKLSEIGFSESDREIILCGLQKPGSIGIVMGPTGSGKTTTLYSLLNELYNGENIAVTIEDPIESWMPGIRQIQINEERMLTFSNTLRSVLRQDPDIILIGEIRDYETALLAFQAALTGHVVISSIHAYDSNHLIPRLLSLGIPEYLIKSLNIVSINQRLIESICQTCKTTLEDLDSEEISKCSICRGSGSDGRILVYEISDGEITLEERIQDLLGQSKISYAKASRYLKKSFNNRLRTK